ncbi:rCG49123, partial [Rattus norvegicus]
MDAGTRNLAFWKRMRGITERHALSGQEHRWQSLLYSSFNLVSILKQLLTQWSKNQQQEVSQNVGHGPGLLIKAQETLLQST